MPHARSDKKVFPDSQSSDDAGIMAVVAQQMQTSWEKKRKEKEAKYLQEAKSTLDECLVAHATAFLEASAGLDAAYEKFVADYATVEDEIRKLLVQLSREQQKMLALAEKKHKRMVESEKARERGQVQGMATAKKAMEDLSRLVTTLGQAEEH